MGNPKKQDSVQNKLIHSGKIQIYQRLCDKREIFEREMSKYAVYHPQTTLYY